jgi:hypothetical protein
MWDVMIRFETCFVLGVSWSRILNELGEHIPVLIFANLFLMLVPPEQVFL